jgi:hypothetical protein
VQRYTGGDASHELRLQSVFAALKLSKQGSPGRPSWFIRLGLAFDDPAAPGGLCPANVETGDCGSGEMANTLALGASAERLAGSSPAFRTNLGFKSSFCR